MKFNKFIDEYIKDAINYTDDYRAEVIYPQYSDDAYLLNLYYTPASSDEFLMSTYQIPTGETLDVNTKFKLIYINDNVKNFLFPYVVNPELINKKFINSTYLVNVCKRSRLRSEIERIKNSYDYSDGVNNDMIDELIDVEKDIKKLRSPINDIVEFYLLARSVNTETNYFEYFDKKMDMYYNQYRNTIES